MRAARPQGRRWRVSGAVVLVLTALLVAPTSGVAEAAGAWTTATRAGLPRQEVSYVEAGGRLYLAGGRTNVQQVFNPATGTWSTVAPIPAPQPLDHMQAAAVNGKIYYIGGMSAWPSQSVDTVYVYDIATNVFSVGAPMLPGRDRGAGAIAVAGNRIYVAGGVHDGTTVAWFDVYDTSTRTWTRLPDLPHRRDHFQGAVVNGRFWAIGGRISAAATRVGYNEAFDLAAGIWSTGYAPLPTLRGGFATAVFGTEIAVIGGEGGGATFDEVEAYDTATNRWRTLTPMPTARHGIQAAMWNGAAYIAAGGTRMGGGGATDVHEVLTLAPASSARPDAQIRLSSQTAFVGNDVYNTTGAGQTRSTTAPPGQRRAFVVRMQNDGSVADGLRLRGCVAAPGFGVRYFMGATGTTEITTAVVNGTYTRSAVAPGGSAAVRLEVTTGATTASGAVQSCLLTVTSTSAPTVADAVLARVTVS